MSDSPAPTPTRIGHIQAEQLSVVELLDAAAIGPVVIDRPFGADPVLVFATPAAGVPAIVAMDRALRRAACGG